MSLPSILDHALREMRPKPPLKDPARLLRVAVGMTVATIVGYLTGTIGGLALVCVGAFLAGIAAVMPHNRPRLSAVSLTTLGEIAALFLGVVVHGIWWVILPVLFIGLLAGGLLRSVTVGLSMRVIVVTIIFLAFAEITTSWHTGLTELGLFAAGGLIMMVAQFLPPIEPAYATQRVAVADLYRALATDGPYGPAILTADRSLALVSHRRSHEVGRLTELVEVAEEIGQLLQAMHNRHDAADRPTLDAISGRCRAIAVGVQRGRLVNAEQIVLDEQTDADRLSNALVRAVNTASSIASTELPADVEASTASRHRPPSALDLVRAELRLSSPMMQHGLRLACAGVVAQLIGLAIGQATPADLVLRGHGFWVVVAVVLILFPDYGETMSRGISRTIGTVFGVGLGIALSFLPSTLAVHALVLTVLYFGYLAFRSCGQAYTMFWVVAWIAALTVGPAGAITRGVETLAGCVLAFVVYLIAPTWHGSRLSSLLTALLRAESERLRAIADLSEQPNDAAADAEVVHATARSRIARMEFTEAVHRASAEPRRVASGGWSADKIAALTPAVANISRQTSVMAAFATGPDADRREKVRLESEEFAGRLQAIAESIQNETTAPTFEPWHPHAGATSNLVIAVESAGESTAELATLVGGLDRH
ncbi:hypothetical protein HH308_18540 [Gordonia sp. TBRC 11910]|uniref:Integral membrane bound transporter domain-containing protein n=1 Tax=Gordonia asplenii TaxID=2725283 RepID=A0A848KX61_9ACTN|nr:FUSC family protein [Gordonia asplenii]NMO03216.1 hypothetical protein [Gordonia asplenii]